MKKYLLGLSIVLLSSCSGSKTISFPALAQVTKIQIVGRNSTTYPFRSKVRWITNKSQISQIVTFVDKQQSGWSPPYLTSMPVSDIGLVFYSGKTEQRFFGVGSNFFSTHGKGDWVLKNTSEQERQELLTLIGSKN